MVEMSKRFRDRVAKPVRRTGGPCDGGEIYVPAAD